MPGKTPSIAKITRPKLAGAYPRTRLFKLLDGCRDTPVTWISSPAGSGKTTLVASYLDARKLPCLWYQLDAGDADPATFFYYLGLAAKKAAPRHKKPLPLLTPEYLMSAGIFSKRFFENLCSRLKVPFVLVFDNYQEVAQDALFHEIFREGLAAVPPGVRVMVISRTDPPPPYASFQAGNRLGLIGREDLMLSVEESSGLIHATGGKKLSRDAAGGIHDKAHGWAAGIILLSKGAQAGKGLLPDDPEKGTPEEVFDYFASELFNRAEPKIRDFLLKTAYLPQITTEAAKMLTGLRESDRVLSRLHQGNYFTEKRYEPELVYQYHPLFREFLLTRAKGSYSPSKIAGLEAKAARILETSGRVEDAAELYILAKDWEGLGRLVMANAPSLMKQGRLQTLASWTDIIPQDRLRTRPWLLYWKGMARVCFDPAGARPLMERAFGLFRKKRDRQGMTMSWCGIIESFQQEWDVYEPLDRWIDEGRRFLWARDAGRHPEADMAVSRQMLMALLYRRPQSPDVKVWCERVTGQMRPGMAPEHRAGAAALLMIYHTWVGELSKVAWLADELRAVLQEESITPLTRIVSRAMHAVGRWFLGENNAARAVIDETLREAHATGLYIWNLKAFAQGAYAALTDGDIAGGKAYLDQMAPFLDRARRLDLSQYHYQMAYYLLLTGEIHAAAEHARQGQRLTEETGVLFAMGLLRTIFAEVLFECGQTAEAQQHLDAAERIAGRMRSNLVGLKIRIIRSYFLFRSGRDAQALAALRQMMMFARQQGFINYDTWRPDVMALLCAKALEHGIEVDYVRDLIRKRSLTPPDANGDRGVKPSEGAGRSAQGKPYAPCSMPSACLDAWPWPYRISTMGTFRLVKNDKPLRLPARAPKKPLELLKALIAFGGSDVSEERITDALWPDATGDAAHSAFTTTLQRLRKLLGDDKVIIVQDGGVSLDRRYVWVDAWAFERMLESSEFEVRNMEQAPPLRDVRNGNTVALVQNKHEIQQRLEKALKLYPGHFLAGDGDKPWAISMRERLRSKYLRAVAMLGRIHEEAGKHAKAAAVYQQGLDVDDLAEEFYQGLMTCYNSMGRRSEAVRVYERCKKTLKAALKVEPGSTTEALFRSIVG